MNGCPVTELADFYARYDVPILIFMLGVLTYFTRIAGYVFLSRFKHIPRPVNAGLEAVPAAVIATLVVPPAIDAGPAEVIALLVAGVACFRLQPLFVIASGLLVLIALRHAGL